MFERRTQSRSLVVSFEGLELTKWIWPSVAEKINANWLGLSDPQDLFYHAGVPGIADDLTGIAETVVDRAEQVKATRIVCIVSERSSARKEISYQ